MKNSLDLNKDKTRVLQVSDPQDLKLVRKSMTEMLGRAYDTMKPDLVVFTGDNILGNHLLDVGLAREQRRRQLLSKGEGELFARHHLGLVLLLLSAAGGKQ